MTAKEYLNRYRRINAAIDTKFEQVSRLRELATRISPSYSRHGNTGTVSDRVGHTVEKIDKLEREINCEIDKLLIAQEEIKHTISQVDDINMRTMLEMRYINLMSWRKIAAKMNYSEKHLTGYLHRRALEEIAEKIKVFRCFKWVRSNKRSSVYAAKAYL